MTTEQQTTPVVPATEAKPVDQAQATTPAVAIPTETPAEHLIPKSRFDEVNEKLRKLEADAAAKAKADQKAEEERLARDAQWQQLSESRKAKIDELMPQVELATKLSAMVLEQYDAEIKAWPEQVRNMAPADDADVLVKLDWMKRAKPLATELMADKTPVAGNGRRPTPSAPAGSGARETAARSEHAKWTRNNI